MLIIVVSLAGYFIIANLFEAGEPYYFSDDAENATGNILVYPGKNQTYFGRDDLPQGWYVIELSNGEWYVLGSAIDSVRARVKPWRECTECPDHRAAWFWGGDH